MKNDEKLIVDQIDQNNDSIINEVDKTNESNEARLDSYADNLTIVIKDRANKIVNE